MKNSNDANFTLKFITNFETLYLTDKNKLGDMY